MIDPAVGALLCAAFALLFGSAALHKLLDRERLAHVVRAYDLVPPALARLSLLVPLLELAIGVGLLLQPMRRRAAVAGALLLLAYAAALAVNVRRGRFDLSCGCGWGTQQRTIARWMVWRNLLLAAALTGLWWPWRERALSAADILTVLAGTAVLALLYASLETLLSRSVARPIPLRGES